MADDDLRSQIAELSERLAAVEANEHGGDALFVSADDGDALWLLLGAVLVFLMQAGFAMLAVGSQRLRSTKAVLIKSVLDASIAALFWWAFGFGVAFGQDDFGKNGNNGFLGKSGYFYEGESGSPLAMDAAGKTYGKAFWLVQWAFAAAAVAIVSGAVAERISLPAYFAYAIALVSFVYPVVAHMAWSDDGKLSSWRTSRLVGGCGVIDFGGSGVVHVTGGVAALVAAKMVGPRLNWKRSVPPAGAVYQTLGTLLLWVGWYGLNGANAHALAGSGGQAAPHVMMTTTIAAATACLATTALGFAVDQEVDARNANNGVLAGLAAISASCAVVNLWGAFVIGLIAAPVYLGAAKSLVFLGIDDVVGAFPVHGACGAWGVLAGGIFATEFYYKIAYFGDDDRGSECAGIFYGGDGGALGAACLFLLFLIAWVGGTLTLLFLALHYSLGLRVDPDAELAGIDDKHRDAADASGVEMTEA